MEMLQVSGHRVNGPDMLVFANMMPDIILNVECLTRTPCFMSKGTTISDGPAFTIGFYCSRKVHFLEPEVTWIETKKATYIRELHVDAGPLLPGAQLDACDTTQHSETREHKLNFWIHSVYSWTHHFSSHQHSFGVDLVPFEIMLWRWDVFKRKLLHDN